MNLRTLSLTLILAFALLAAFVMLNWAQVALPVTLSLGLMTVTAPLGVVILGFTAVISALFVLYIGFQQAAVILETRRLAKQVDAQRKIAEDAESSRFIELRAMLEGELQKVAAQHVEGGREVFARIERSELVLQEKLAEATSSMSAHLGEIEDKLDRKLAL